VYNFYTEKQDLVIKTNITFVQIYEGINLIPLVEKARIKINNLIEQMKANKDFEYVIRVLNSCVTLEQIKTSENLFENFKNKWKKQLNCFELVEFIFKFKSERKKQKRKI
jgi:hypothetical protein